MLRNRGKYSQYKNRAEWDTADNSGISSQTTHGSGKLEDILRIDFKFLGARWEDITEVDSRPS